MSITVNEVVIESRADGFINATQMCKAGGKKFNHWYALDITKKLIETLEKDVNFNTEISVLKLVDKKVGGNHSGSWIHPDLAVQLAQWISPVFAIKVSRWVRELVTIGSVSINTTKTDEELLELQKKLEQRDQELEQRDKELKEERTKNQQLEKKQLVLATIVDNFIPLEKNQIFYIATTISYAAQNRFKFGGVKSVNDIKGRLNTYNTGRAQNDLIYISKYFMCHNYKQIESRIGEILSRFRDKQNSQKELLFIQYERLIKIAEFICDHYNYEIEYINENCQEIFNELINDNLVVPEPINFEDSIEIITTRNNIIQTKKIDISNWSDEQVEKALIEILNVCVTKIDIKHNFEAGDVAANFDWSEISKNIKEIYVEKNMKRWRDVFKSWYRNSGCKKLKIKGIKITE